MLDIYISLVVFEQLRVKVLLLILADVIELQQNAFGKKTE